MKRLGLGLGLLFLVCVLGIHGSRSLTKLHADSQDIARSDAPISSMAVTAPSPPPVTDNKTVVVPVAPQPDPATTNIQLCKKVTDEAKQWSIQTNDQFFADLHRWMDTFAGELTTSNALSSKQFYIDNTKKLYANYAAEAAAPYARFCGGSGVITDILFEPNYDAL